jgi:glyoxylate reductase
VILTNLRNLISLHNFLWEGKWKSSQKWDLDENLNNTMDNLVLGIVGMGEIGREVIRRVGPWGIKIIYYDIARNEKIEQKYPNIQFFPNIEDVFSEADVVSIHIPLLPETKGIVNANLLKKMKPNAVLINTSRGPIINEEDLIRLLKNKEITIHLALDVYDPEPISDEHLKVFHEIMQNRPELRFVFIPHNASADADTRAKMDIIILNDLLTLVQSKTPEDLKTLRLIPSQRKLLDPTSKINWAEYRIKNYWQ